MVSMYAILLGGFRLEIYGYMVSRWCVHHCFWLVIYRYCVKVVYPVSIFYGCSYNVLIPLPSNVLQV